MPGRIAVDFGTSNTVVSNWDSVRQQGQLSAVPEFGRFLQMNDEQVSVIPSLIHYGSSGPRWYGNQVIQRNLTSSARSFQWMKRYISMRSPATRKIDEKHISNFEAAEDYLTQVFNAVKENLLLGDDEEVALTLPVEAFEHYENWLSGVAKRAGLNKIRFIDEPSAAALGYSTRMFPEEACLVFDLGGGSLDVSIVKQEGDPHDQESCCRVIGKAGVAFGGSHIDEWVFQEVISLNGSDPSDPEIQQISRLLLSECETLKERLSTQEKSSLTVMNPLTGSLISVDFSRAQLESLLQAHGAYALVATTLQRALSDAREHGFDENNLKTVLMVGGCSQIPSIQNVLYQIFGKEKVKCDRPLDAIARGAASFISGQKLNDYLQHDYTVRHQNSSTGQFEYRELVPKGSVYPSKSTLAKLTVKAVQDNQSMLGLAIYEMGQKGPDCQPRGIELFFDESGNARINAVSQSELDRRSIFCVNEENKTFLEAEPPAMKGDARFEVSFSMDANCRLLISTRDLQTDRFLHVDYPLVELS